MRYFFFSSVLALAACNPQGPPPPPIETPPAAEARPASFVSAISPADARTLRFRVRAPSGHPLYLENCNGAFSWGLEHRVAGVWKPAWIVATDACHSAPILIPPGESRDFSEAITLAADEHLEADTYRIAVHGLYRTHEGDDHAAGDEVPGELRVSEPFALGPLSAPRTSLGEAPTRVDSIVLERTPCYGTCPAYRLSIARSGAVHFRSQHPADTVRTAADTISPAAFESLVREAERIGFRELPEEIRGSRFCNDEATDHPSAIVTLFTASESKRVDDYEGCSDGPKPLREFQARIDRVAGSERWVRPPRFR